MHEWTDAEVEAEAMADMAAYDDDYLGYEEDFQESRYYPAGRTEGCGCASCDGSDY